MYGQILDVVISFICNYCGRSLGAEEDYEKQATQNMKYQAEDAASRATETMKSAASGNIYLFILNYHSLSLD